MVEESRASGLEDGAMPTIGITSSDSHGPDGHVHPDVVPYVRAVERFGGDSVLLANDPGNIEELLATLGGIIFSGGVDVDPIRYGGNLNALHAQTGRYRQDRDAFEIELALAARDLRVPSLCICRGLQIANVAFGGTLIEDLRAELGERYTLNHRQTHENGQDRSDYAPGHDVHVEARSALAGLVASTSFPTNSMHHQAIREPGDGLIVVGRTSDGVVEALDAAFDHPFFFAVQWHPEELPDDTISRKLFNGLVRCARQRRSRNHANSP